MKIYIKLLFAITTLTFIAVSCSDYLDVPINGTLTPESFYNSDEDANSAVLAAYDMLTWNNNPWGWCAPVFVKTLPSDEGSGGGASPGDQPDYDALDKFTFDSGNSKVEGLWSLAYYGIYRSNLVIDNVVGDSDRKQLHIAEALALRAYNYLDIAAFYGGGPLLTTTDITPDEYDQPRADADVLYAQIEADLAAAIPDLPVKSAYADSDKFRVSKGTAQSLLGKARLYNGDYTGALSAFQEVINSGEYTLDADFASIFRTNGELGSGSIFEAVFSNDVGHNWGTNPWDLGQSERQWESNMHIQLMGPREGEFGNTENGIIEGWGFNYPSVKLAEMYDAAGDTVRKNATLMSEADYNAAGGAITGNAYDYNGYVRLKYGTYPDESDSETSIQQNYGTNWRLIRYADVLLMAAEAAAFSGDEETARQYINMVRERAGLAATNASGGDLVTVLQNERMLELAFEGFRYIDLIRWDAAEAELGTFGYTDRHSLFPVPANEILRSPSLDQNPGW